MSPDVMPHGVQRRRTRGWKTPVNTIYVGRRSQWGNYCKSLAEFEREAEHRAQLDSEWLEPLRGKNLSCWCELGEPCHRDILLKLANR